ncbi:Hypothetical protein D9617_4g001060 [Elsinoe fawcettii]|nr:Hypothetical protein D9617_4g001060 [Elsinoe fawcettii]
MSLFNRPHHSTFVRGIKTDPGAAQALNYSDTMAGNKASVGSEATSSFSNLMYTPNASAAGEQETIAAPEHARTSSSLRATADPPLRASLVHAFTALNNDHNNRCDEIFFAEAEALLSCYKGLVVTVDSDTTSNATAHASSTAINQHSPDRDHEAQDEATQVKEHTTNTTTELQVANEKLQSTNENLSATIERLKCGNVGVTSSKDSLAELNKSIVLELIQITRTLVGASVQGSSSTKCADAHGKIGTFDAETTAATGGAWVCKEEHDRLLMKNEELSKEVHAMRITIASHKQRGYGGSTSTQSLWTQIDQLKVDKSTMQNQINEKICINSENLVKLRGAEAKVDELKAALDSAQKRIKELEEKPEQVTVPHSFFEGAARGRGGYVAPHLRLGRSPYRYRAFDRE